MPDYRSIAAQKARKYGLDVDTFLRQIGQESGFNPNAHSPAGAIGIAQIMPATARGWGVDPNDPVAALDAAAKNMAAYAQKYGGIRNALIAYNAGPGAIGKPLPAETKAYIAKIMGGDDGGGSAVPTTTGSLGAPPAAQSQDNGFGDMLKSFQQMNDSVAQSGYKNPFDPNPNGILDLLSKINQPRPASQGPQASSSADGAGPAASGGAGTTDFEGTPVASWIAPILRYARERGWQGKVTSGYRSDTEQKAIYDRGTRPAAKPVSEGGGGSNHSRTGFLQGAIDVSDAPTLDAILRRKHSRLQFAGAKDPVHFSVPRGGTY